MNPLYFKARFLRSALHLQDAPPDEGLEIAFAGRSNAGKSSAINTLTGQGSLARTSKTPGRTQLLNFFGLDDSRRLVDLPGYGYAKVPEAIQKGWAKAMETYLQKRQSLRGVIILMDIRHPLTDHDRKMVEWLAYCNLPMHIALTKADKLSRGASKGALLKVQSQLNKDYGGHEISVQLFSAPARQGIDEAHALMDRWLGFAETAAATDAE